MSEVKYCIVCLTTGVKLFGLKDYSLGQIYSDFTKIPVLNWNQHLCIECAFLLQKYQKFKLKCIQTDDILSKSVSLTGLTESVLEKMQEEFNIGSYITYSEITTEDVLAIDPDCTDIDKIENIDDTNVCCSADQNDNGLFIVLENEPENLLIEYPKTNLSISIEGIDKSTETSREYLLNPRVVLERLEDVTIKQHTSVTQSNDVCDSLCDDNEFHNEEVEPQSEGDDWDAGSLQSNSSWTETLHYDGNLSKQTLDASEIPTEETLVGETNESLHSNSSWTAILNTLSRIDTVNKKLFSKAESIAYKTNVGSNKNLSKVQKENNKINFKNTIEHIKQAVKLITTIKTPVCDKSPKESIMPSGKWNGLSKSEYTTRLVANLEKDGHTVLFLSKEQAKNEVLNRAKSDNYTKSPYKCDLCFRGYKKEETLANHMLKHSPQRGPFECVYCHFRYPKQKFYKSHMNNMHRTKFTCKLCPFGCEQLDRAINHVRSHQGTTYDCKFCDKKFNVRNTLFNHIHIKHQDKYEQYLCEFCGNSFHSKNGLNIHKDKLHYNEINEMLGPSCEQCGIHFASQHAWDRHLVVSNNHRALNTSESKPPDIVRKPRKPRGPSKKPPQKCTCEFCGMEVSSEYWYKVHLYKHHDHPKPVQKRKPEEKNLMCEICGEHFSIPFRLKTHLRKHTGERPYECEYCGKRYRLQLTLKLHENMHTRAKLYKCGICDKEFLLPASHSKHVRGHIGFTPHKCLECDRSFINLSRLKYHIKHKHEKVPYPLRKNLGLKDQRLTNT